MAVDDVNHLDVPEPFQIDLDVPTTFRDGDPDTNKDSLLKNVFVDIKPNGMKYVCKRPGTAALTTFNGGGAATTQGLFNYNGFTLAVANNTVSRIVSLTSTGFGTGVAWSNIGAAPWIGRAQHASVVFKGQILVIGGTLDGTNYLRDTWATADGQNWVQLNGANPWGARGLMGAVVYNDRLYVMGGVEGGVFYNDVWVSDNGVDWTLVTSGASWSARSSFIVLAYNNGIYLIGGNTSGTEVWFSTDGKEWVRQVTGAFGGVGRALSAGVVHNNTMFVIGGAGAAGLQVYSSTDGRTWTLVTGAAFGGNSYMQGAAVSYNGKLYYIGGFSAGAEQTTVWESTNGAAWALTVAAYGGAGIAQLSAVVFKAPFTAGSVINAPVIYVLGGRTAVPSYLQNVWYSNLNGNLSTNYALPGAVAPYLPMQAAPANNNEVFALKDIRSMWVWKADQWQLVTDKNYPVETVPGVVNLDETVYVMDPDAVIRGSALGNPLVWPSMNFIGADFKSDPGTALGGYSNFVVAFGTHTLQVFYNSGAPGTASLLRPVKSANTNIGCSYPYTVTKMENTLVWVGRAEDKGLQVFAFQGTTPVPISTTDIEAVLDSQLAADTQLEAASLKVGGHPWYVLTAPAWTWGALVYDFAVKRWYIWYTGLEGWAYLYPVIGESVNSTLILAKNSRTVFTFDTTSGADGLNAITCLIRTLPVNQNTNRLKYCSMLTVIGDRVANATMRLRYSDDDGITWSGWRIITSNQARQCLRQMGKYRQRIFELEHASDTTTSWRVRQLELELNLGKL